MPNKTRAIVAASAATPVMPIPPAISESTSAMTMWLRLIAIAIGLCVQASAYVFGCDGPAAANLYIVGPIVASIACIAIWEVMRPMRWVNLLLGVWLAISPLFLNYPT